MGREDDERILSESEIEEVMRRDAFSEDAEPRDDNPDPQDVAGTIDAGHERAEPVDAEPVEEPTPEPVEEPAPAEEPVAAEPVETPTEEPETPAVNPEMELLRDSNRQLTQQLQAMQSQVQALLEQRQQPTAKEQPKPQEQLQPLQIPDNIWAALESEEPAHRRMGLGALMTGVLQLAHKQIGERFEQQLNDGLSQVSTSIKNETVQEREVRERQAAVANDFYGRYEDLNKPELRNLVMSVGTAVMNETGQRQWTPQLRDAIADRVYRVLGRPRPGSQGQATHRTGNGQRAPVTTQRGVRPPMVGEGRPSEAQQVQDILDIF